MQFEVNIRETNESPANPVEERQVTVSLTTSGENLIENQVYRSLTAGLTAIKNSIKVKYQEENND